MGTVTMQTLHLASLQRLDQRGIIVICTVWHGRLGKCVVHSWKFILCTDFRTLRRSGVILAHVRAAGPGMGVCHCSCHPFEFGRFLFMHNGQVAGFGKIRRKLMSSLNSCAYDFAIANSVTTQPRRPPCVADPCELKSLRA